MNPDNINVLIGIIGLVAIILLGFFLILRSMFMGLIGSIVPLSTPAGFGRGVLGRTVASLLSFAVVYRFFFAGYTGKLYGIAPMFLMLLFALFAMTLVPAIETLVAIAALTIFLMENSVFFGQGATTSFLGFLLLFAILRWFIGR